MRKIEEIANLKFNGEIEKALEFVFKNYHIEEVIKIADELTKEECQYFLLMQEKWASEKEKNNLGKWCACGSKRRVYARYFSKIWYSFT